MCVCHISALTFKPSNKKGASVSIFCDDRNGSLHVVESIIQLLSPAEKMISSEVLEGVPLLVLANKQDVPVLYDLFN